MVESEVVETSERPRSFRKGKNISAHSAATASSFASGLTSELTPSPHYIKNGKPKVQLSDRQTQSLASSRDNDPEAADDASLSSSSSWENEKNGEQQTMKRGHDSDISREYNVDEHLQNHPQSPFQGHDSDFSREYNVDEHYAEADRGAGPVDCSPVSRTSSNAAGSGSSGGGRKHRSPTLGSLPPADESASYGSMSLGGDDSLSSGDSFNNSAHRKPKIPKQVSTPDLLKKPETSILKVKKQPPPTKKRYVPSSLINRGSNHNYHDDDEESSFAEESSYHSDDYGSDSSYSLEPFNSGLPSNKSLQTGKNNNINNNVNNNVMNKDQKNKSNDMSGMSNKRMSQQTIDSEDVSIGTYDDIEEQPTIRRLSRRPQGRQQPFSQTIPSYPKFSPDVVVEDDREEEDHDHEDVGNDSMSFLTEPTFPTIKKSTRKQTKNQSFSSIPPASEGSLSLMADPKDYHRPINESLLTMDEAIRSPKHRKNGLGKGGHWESPASNKNHWANQATRSHDDDDDEDEEGEASFNGWDGNVGDFSNWNNNNNDEEMAYYTQQAAAGKKKKKGKSKRRPQHQQGQGPPPHKQQVQVVGKPGSAYDRDAPWYCGDEDGEYFSDSDGSSVLPQFRKQKKKKKAPPPPVPYHSTSNTSMSLSNLKSEKSITLSFFGGGGGNGGKNKGDGGEALLGSFDEDYGNHPYDMSLADATLESIPVSQLKPKSEVSHKRPSTVLSETPSVSKSGFKSEQTFSKSETDEKPKSSIDEAKNVLVSSECRRLLLIGLVLFLIFDIILVVLLLTKKDNDNQSEMDAARAVVLGTVTNTICLDWLPREGKSELCTPEETALGGGVSNLLAAAIMNASPLPVDIAMIPAGLARADIPEGDFTVGTLQDVLGMSGDWRRRNLRQSNDAKQYHSSASSYASSPSRSLRDTSETSMVILQATGMNIKNVLEKTVDHALSGHTTNYPYAAGMQFTVNSESSLNSRIVSVEIANEAIVESNIYSVITTTDWSNTYFLLSGEPAEVTPLSALTEYAEEFEEMETPTFSTREFN